MWWQVSDWLDITSSRRFSRRRVMQPSHATCTLNGSSLPCMFNYTEVTISFGQVWSIYQCRCYAVTSGNFILLYNPACCWTMQWQPANREAAFKSAFDILTPEEYQILRLFPEKASETSHHLTPHGSHQGICTRVKTDLLKCTLTASAVFCLVLTYLANNACRVWAFLSFCLFFFNYCLW